MAELSLKDRLQPALLDLLRPLLGRGLAACGVNRNQTPCGCAGQPAGGRKFGALAKMKL